jgi:hypothetical protein
MVFVAHEGRMSKKAELGGFNNRLVPNLRSHVGTRKSAGSQTEGENADRQAPWANSRNGKYSGEVLHLRHHKH